MNLKELNANPLVIQHLTLLIKKLWIPTIMGSKITH